MAVAGGGADDLAGAHAAAGVDFWCAAEFAPHNNGDVLVEAARVEVLDEGAEAEVEHRQGGEVTEYVKLMAESREQALDRMLAEAEKLGANGVISIQFTTSVIMGGAAEMMAYGTAVVIEDE